MKETKILIVDDKPENLLTLEFLLNGPDIEIIRAESGEQALSHSLDHDFALVLLDVRMPGMDGYEVAEFMRCNKKTKNVPIIFVTAEVQGDHHIFKGYESGAVDYLFKPLNEVVLKSKVNVFIELFKQHEELQLKTVELDAKLVELEELQAQLEEVNEQLMMLSITDGLTGLINRRHFDVLLAEEWKRAHRKGESVSLLLMDVDHFKEYNDTYGHAVGDDCLKKIAYALSRIAMRDADKIARVGGEEFAMILPGTDIKGAAHVADRIRVYISELALPHSSSTTSDIVTISIGVTCQVPGNANATRDLYIAADEALYTAKTSGRNRIACA